MGVLFADRYDLTSELGSGNFGQVWEAHDAHLDYRVAVKLFQRATPFAVVAEEARALTALQSPNILKVWNADVHNDVPYVVTEVAPLGSVEDHLGEHGLEVERAVRWARHALAGLSVCHEQSFVHRDIKPSNMFLNSENEALLGDFGVATRITPQGLAAPHGDVRIRPPEAYTSNSVDLTADTYAIGVSLYWMLAGSCPFDAPTVSEQVEAVINGRYPKLRELAPHVPQSLAQKVARSMDADVARRFATAQEFHDALGRTALGNYAWRRTAHPDHEMCWDGPSRTGGLGITICVVRQGSTYTIDTRRSGGSRMRIREYCGEERTRQRLMMFLRRVFGGLAG